MTLAHRTRQSGNAATRWPITVLLSNGSGTDGDWPPRCRVAALPRCRVAALSLCRVLCARAIKSLSVSCKSYIGEVVNT